MQKHSQRHSRAIILSATTQFYALTLLILTLNLLIKFNTVIRDTQIFGPMGFKLTPRICWLTFLFFFFFLVKSYRKIFKTEITLFHIATMYI